MNGINHCGAYLEHLQSEHHRLNCALLEIRHQFAELRRNPQPQVAVAALIERLDNLRSELSAHFAEEEAGGCLEEAVARCPSLGPEVKALMGEHPELARALEELLARMKSQTPDEEARQQQFEAFAAALKAHECAENRVLQFALGGDAAEYDMEGNE
jgi:predicted  nucleic acid-binding Zn-ribbon protein